ncbi:hypothetical protein F2Q68_00016741 [Brassica cretica]|uniref:Uncharacterized protein n=1 Tax=Brassica cretica TaxID=69181 RepID=A0A8S9HIS9_BRACR|nr:hypothetical protein F2Q68_00016741 [Brassica cretica]
MDNSQKKKIETPTPKSKFEDSPVFNYINNLSPIEAVRSIPTVQTFNTLSFTSPPPVFTSPHASFHRESRFFRCHNSVERSKALESLDRSVSTQEEVVVASGEVDLNKEATLEDQEEDETSRDRVDSPGTGDIVTQVLLDPSGVAPQGEDNASSSTGLVNSSLIYNNFTTKMKTRTLLFPRK